MGQIEEMTTTDITKKTEERVNQLLQVWRDYYDEIFEVEFKSGRFESMMESKHGKWPVRGFAEIEVVILAEKSVHPDDKQAFKDFFDVEAIERRIRAGIFVTKLNFRIRIGEEYVWVKVKNIVPTKQESDSKRFFACFRRVDDETGQDLRYKQDLVDALEKERQLGIERQELINRVTTEIRSPLNGIIGMAALAKTDTSNQQLCRDRFKVIEAEAIKMSRSVRALIQANSDDEVSEFEFEDHPINKISYGRRTDSADTPSVDDEELKSLVPEGFAIVTGVRDTFTPTREDEFVFTGRRVLIAEDNRLNSSVIKELFEKAGAEAVVTEDGKSAVVEFVSKPAGTYDLILVDLMIPYLDGFSIQHCIRMSCKEDAHTVPVFALTANTTNTDIVRAYKEGFNAYFTKPVDFRILFGRIQELWKDKTDNGTE